MAKKGADFQLPDQGFVFWPVGTGDSTTVAVNKDLRIQVDVREMGCASDDGDPHAPIIQRLVELLPKKNNRPYLSVFVLTHLMKITAAVSRRC